MRRRRPGDHEPGLRRASRGGPRRHAEPLHHDQPVRVDVLGHGVSEGILAGVSGMCLLWATPIRLSATLSVPLGRLAPRSEAGVWCAIRCWKHRHGRICSYFNYVIVPHSGGVAHEQIVSHQGSQTDSDWQLQRHPSSQEAAGQKYGWSDRLTLEEMEDSIILRGKETHYLSWEETYSAMAEESEDWSDFDVAIADGVD